MDETEREQMIRQIVNKAADVALASHSADSVRWNALIPCQFKAEILAEIRRRGYQFEMGLGGYASIWK